MYISFGVQIGAIVWLYTNL